MLIEKLTEVAINVTLTVKVIADRRLKADLYGLKAEKAHISGKKCFPFVFAHQAHLFFILQLLFQQPVASRVTSDRLEPTLI